jgi:DNA-directed RNA polymerase subunit RPC12/RpoP
MSRAIGGKFNYICPDCDKKFYIKSGNIVPKHLPIGHIDDKKSSCSGSGKEGIRLKPVLRSLRSQCPKCGFNIGDILSNVQGKELRLAGQGELLSALECPNCHSKLLPV